MYINFYQYSGRFAHFPVLISTPVIFPSLRVSLKLISCQCTDILLQLAYGILQYQEHCCVFFFKIWTNRFQ